MAQKTRSTRRISDTDREILRALLERDGNLNTTALAGQIRVPRSTVERRRRYLEANLLTSYYHMDVRKIGYRRVDFLIETGGGSTRRIADQLMQLREVTAVMKTIGEHTIDLIAELIVKDNGEILTLSEKVKGMRGVRDVTWTEVVEEERKKKPVPDYIIDEL